MGVSIIIHDTIDGISFETNWKNREESCKIENFSQGGFKWFLYDFHHDLSLDELKDTSKIICPSSIKIGCQILIESIFRKISQDFQDVNLDISDFDICDNMQSMSNFFNTPSPYLSKIVLKMVSKITKSSNILDSSDPIDIFHKYSKKIKKIKSIASYPEYYTRFFDFVLFLQWISERGHSISWSC